MSKVAEHSAEQAGLVARLQPIRDLMGGSRAMRQAGKRWLPKFPAETEEAYRDRLAASWLFNGLRKTVRDMTGRVFRVPVMFDGEPAEPWPTWGGNIDLSGRTLNSFARDLFEDGLQAGISWVMVEAPDRDGIVTRAQADAANVRPYLIHLRAEEVLGWRMGLDGAAPVIAQLRIMETVTEPDPDDEFGQVAVQQVRVLDRTETGVAVRLYRKGKNGWALFAEPRFTGLREITVAPFYAARTGFWCAEPPLEDLADVNIAHWQSQSDQRNILHMARVPILFGAGFAADDTIEISSAKAVIATDPAAKLSFVEHSGAAIEAGRTDLKDLEFQMETFGLQLLVQRAQGQSATGEALDAAKETTTLAMLADGLKATLDRALGWMAEYGGLGEAPAVVVNKDFGATAYSQADLQVLLSAVTTGQISQATFLGELKRRGLLADEVDPEAEIGATEADREALMQPPAHVVNDGTGERSPA